MFIVATSDLPKQREASWWEQFSGMSPNKGLVPGTPTTTMALAAVDAGLSYECIGRTSNNSSTVYGGQALESNWVGRGARNRKSRLVIVQRSQ